MKLGDKRVFIFNKPWGYHLRTPAPYTEQNADNHVASLGEGARLEDLEVVELTVTAVRPAVRAVTGDTDRCPPLSPDEALGAASEGE